MAKELNYEVIEFDLINTGLFKADISFHDVQIYNLIDTCFKLAVIYYPKSDKPKCEWYNGYFASTRFVLFEHVLELVNSEIQEGLLFNLDLFR